MSSEVPTLPVGCISSSKFRSRLSFSCRGSHTGRDICHVSFFSCRDHLKGRPNKYESLEQNIGIIAACAPALRQLHKILRRKRCFKEIVYKHDDSQRAALARPSHNSSVSFCTTEMETKRDIGSPKSLSPQAIDSPTFERPGLPSKPAEVTKKNHIGKARERAQSVMELRQHPVVPASPASPASGKSWSPRLVDAPYAHRPSLTPDQAQIIKDYHLGKSKERADSVIEIRKGPESPGFGKRWSPRVMDSPSSHRPSLTPEQSGAIKEYHSKSKESAQSILQARQEPPSPDSPGSPVSPGFGKRWSPRVMESPSSHRPSLTPEQSGAIKEYHCNKSKEKSQSVLESRNKSKSGSGKGWSPRIMDSPRFHRPSLTPEQSEAIQEYHAGKRSEERVETWEEGRQRCVAKIEKLKFKPELGYSCTVEAGPSTVTP